MAIGHATALEAVCPGIAHRLELLEHLFPPTLHSL